MKNFMLAFYDPQNMFAGKSLSEMEEVIQEYGAWMQQLGEDRIIGADKLRVDEPGRVLHYKEGEIEVRHGYHNETETLGGTMIFKAKDYNEACNLVRNHPQLKYRGTIEIREIDPI